jgi:hypothetical protein
MCMIWILKALSQTWEKRLVVSSCLCLSVRPSVRLSFPQSFRLSFPPSVRLSFLPSVRLSFPPPVGLSFPPSVCLSFRPSARNNLCPTGRIVMKWYSSTFLNSVEKVQPSLKSDTNSEYCTWGPKYVYVNISLSSSKNEKLFWKKKMLQRKSKHIFYVQ